MLLMVGFSTGHNPLWAYILLINQIVCTVYVAVTCLILWKGLP